MSNTTFSSLPLAEHLLQSLDGLGYSQMTPIQQQALPALLEGKDILAKARTGSGKTVAFALTLLHKLAVKRFRIQSLVLCPTRELAEQVAQEIRRLARSQHNIKVLTLVGGVSIGPQIGSLEHGAHIIVGTPGRILEMLDRNLLNLSDVETLVLDEADRMLDMGFADDIGLILNALPSDRQTLLFSATYPEKVNDLKRHLKTDAVQVFIEDAEQTQIEQKFIEVQTDEKIAAIKQLLSWHGAKPTLIFSNMRKDTQNICDELAASGYSVMPLHGDLEQRDRERVLMQFTNQSCLIMVATDVAARGLDISALPLVINYDLANDPEVHVHRVGRTGRAGSEGLALTLVTPSQMGRLAALEDQLSLTAQWAELTAFPAKAGIPSKAPMRTIMIDGGKKDKVRPGDIVGALTGELGLSFEQLGKINVLPMVSFVAVRAEVATVALKRLGEGKIKGRQFRCRLV